MEYHPIMPGKLAQAPVVCVLHNGVFVFWDTDKQLDWKTKKLTWEESGNMNNLSVGWLEPGGTYIFAQL